MVTSNSPLANCLVFTAFLFGFYFYPNILVLLKQHEENQLGKWVRSIVFGWTLAVITWSLTIHPVRYLFDR